MNKTRLSTVELSSARNGRSRGEIRSSSGQARKGQERSIEISRTYFFDLRDFIDKQEMFGSRETSAS